MKNHFLIKIKWLALLAPIFCCFSLQGQMIYTLQTSANSYFYSIYPEPGTDKYFIINVNWNYSQAAQIDKAQILKISSSGILLDSLNFDFNFDMGISWIATGNYYYYYGTQIKNYPDNSQSFFSKVFKIDQGLNVVQETIIDTSHNDRIQHCRMLLKNNRLYTVNTHLSTNSLHLYKTDLNLVKQDSLTSTGIALDMADYGNHILISGNGFPQSSVYNSNQVMEMDTSFNALSRFNLDSVTTLNLSCTTQIINMFGLVTNLHPVSSEKYVVVGYGYTTDSATCSLNNVQNLISVIKNNHQILNTTIVGNSRKNNIISIPRIPESMRYNYIWTTAETGYDTSNPNPPPQTNTTQILVYKTDTMGHVVWSRYYADSGIYYIPYNIIATADSGAVICGMRYNLINPQVPGICEGFVMKINKDGTPQYVGIKDNGRLNTEYRCYPDPATDKLYFDLPLQQHIEIRLYDVLGRQVLLNENYENLSALSIANLPSGAYIFRIRCGSKNYSGRFIRQ